MKKLFAVGLLAVLLSACTVVSTGNVGVERFAGKVSESVLMPGVYATVFDSVDEITTKEISFQLNDLTPKSRDNLTMREVDLDIYYRVNPSSVRTLYVKYIGQLEEHAAIVPGGTSDLVVAHNRVLREAREAAYRAIADFDATTMHTRRPEISEKIVKILQGELDKSDKGSFIITAVNVRNLSTDKAIENAIRAQVAMDQNIINKTKQIELAQKEAERQVAQATGEAQANEILSRSLTPQLVEIRLAEIRQATIVSASKNPGSTVLLDANATPLVNTK